MHNLFERPIFAPISGQFCCCSLSSRTAPARNLPKFCSGFNFGALSMLLEPMRWVDVGLPADSKGIFHLAGNWPENTVVGLQVGSLANGGVLLVLLALRPSLSVPHRHFRQDFQWHGRMYLFFSKNVHHNKCVILTSPKIKPSSKSSEALTLNWEYRNFVF